MIEIQAPNKNAIAALLIVQKRYLGMFPFEFLKLTKKPPAIITRVSRKGINLHTILSFMFIKFL